MNSGDRLLVWITAALLTISPMVVVLLGIITINEAPEVPRCAEDVVLIGVGDFEDGRWTEYTCGPARDDYTP